MFSPRKLAQTQAEMEELRKAAWLAQVGGLLRRAHYVVIYTGRGTTSSGVSACPTALVDRVGRRGGQWGRFAHNSGLDSC